jgi:hypothetical protein
MSEKIAKLGIERDNNLMYYIKNGDVWATPRKKPGQAKGKPRKIEDAGVEMDYTKYIYFLDGDGDISRKARAQGGGGKRRTKAKADKPVKMDKPMKNGKPPKASKPSRRGKKSAETTTATPRNGNGKKSEAQIAREVDECLAKARGNGTLPKGETATASAGARKRGHWRY